MKKILVFFVLGVFFAIVAAYVVQSFTPFNLERLQEIVIANEIKPGDWTTVNAEIQNLVSRGLILDYLSTNAYVAFFSAVCSIILLFTTIHLIIDKLFFKNFYEQPSIFNALRRGLLAGVIVVLVAYMKLSAIPVHIIILVPVTIVIIEILFVAYIKNQVLMRFKKSEDPINSTEEKFSDVRTL